MSKNVVENEGPQMTSQYGAFAFHAGLAGLYALMRIQMPTRPGTNMYARTHARTREHARTDQYMKLIAFPRQKYFANTPQYYVMRTLSVLFLTKLKLSKN
jgi:hypothetical protein